MQVVIKTFYASIRSAFGGSLTPDQVSGMDALFAAWDAGGYSDLRDLAGIMGNVRRETGSRMIPVREGFAVDDAHARKIVAKRAYGKPGKDGQVAYGRGPIQVTWPGNYVKADAMLALGGRLVENYDLALDPKIGGAIAVRGCMEGWFTKYRMPDFFTSTVTDWAHMRQVVNRMDHADEVATFAKQFYAALLAAVDTTTTAPPPAPPPEAPAKPLSQSKITWGGAIAAGSSTLVVIKTGVDQATGVANQAKDLGNSLSGLWATVDSPWTLYALAAAGAAGGLFAVYHRYVMHKEQGV